MYKVEYSMMHCDIFAEWDDFLAWIEEINVILRENNKLEISVEDFDVTEVYTEYTDPEDFVNWYYSETAQKAKLGLL